MAPAAEAGLGLAALFARRVDLGPGKLIFQGTFLRFEGLKARNKRGTKGVAFGMEGATDTIVKASTTALGMLARSAF
jgi:hypothetical protein